MVNEFVLDDLSSSWTDLIYQNKSKSEYTPKLRLKMFGQTWRHFSQQLRHTQGKEYEFLLSHRMNSVSSASFD